MASPHALHGPINLGNPGEFQIIELARKVLAMTGSHSALVYESLPEDDPVQRQPDITLARTNLDWLPTVDLDEGLGETIRYFERVLSEA